MSRARASLCGSGPVLAVVLLAACGPSRSPQDPEVRAEAQKIWSDRCANCHGPTGNADGPQARHLLVPPRRLSDRAWQSSVTDDHLRTVILEGGAAVGLNPDLRSRPEVLDALVAHVRSL